MILTCFWVGESDNRNIHVYNLVFVRFWYLQRWLQTVKEFSNRFKRNIHRTLRVKLNPDLIEHVIVFISDAIVYIFLGLGVVLKNNSNVHVNDDN